MFTKYSDLTLLESPHRTISVTDATALYLHGLEDIPEPRCEVIVRLLANKGFPTLAHKLEEFTYGS